jgi:hypothetical protein
MKVFVINGHLLVEFIRLFSTNALFWLKNSAIVFIISGAVRAKDGKITETLASVITWQFPQKHRFQAVGWRAILKR